MSEIEHATQDFVIDASVGIKLFVEDPLSAAAHAHFARLTTDPPDRFYVPELFYIEITNVLWKYVRWHGLAPKEAQAFLEQLNRIALVSIPMADLMVDALNLATATSVSAYDASYVVLAQRLNAPLITADRKLAIALNLPDHIHILGQ